MSLPWIKFYTDWLDEPRLGLLPERLRWRFVQLLLLAAECGAGGQLRRGGRAYGLEELAWRLRVKAKRLEADLAALEAAGLLRREGEVWWVVDFPEGAGASAEEQRQGWREQKQRQRQRRREEGAEASVEGGQTCPRTSSRTGLRTGADVRAVESDIESDQESEEESEREEEEEGFVSTPHGDNLVEKSASAVEEEWARATDYFIGLYGAKVTEEEHRQLRGLEGEFGVTKLQAALGWASQAGIPRERVFQALAKALPKWVLPEEERRPLPEAVLRPGVRLAPVWREALGGR